MIFQRTIDKVLSGEKTQTRRIVRLDEIGLYNDNDQIVGVFTRDNKTRYLLAKEYAVQPGRGKPAVARVQITGIRRGDVRTISAEDVRAEGFLTASDFFLTWCAMHDKGVSLPVMHEHQNSAIVWQGVRSIVATRPAAHYDAWVLEFRLVEDGR